MAAAQFGRQLALLFDAPEHRRAAVFQLAQVGQARFQFTQLDVVQALGGFLAVAGDEGDGGAGVEQFDGVLHLGRPNLQFGGDLQNDLVQETGRREGGGHEGRGVCHGLRRPASFRQPRRPASAPRPAPPHGRVAKQAVSR